VAPNVFSLRASSRTFEGRKSEGELRNKSEGARPKIRNALELQYFSLKLLLQMPSRRFFDGAPFIGHSLLLGLAFLAGPFFHRARQMRDLRPSRAHFPLVRLGVGVHSGFYNLSNPRFCECEGRFSWRRRKRLFNLAPLQNKES